MPIVNDAPNTDVRLFCHIEITCLITTSDNNIPSSLRKCSLIAKRRNVIVIGSFMLRWKIRRILWIVVTEPCIIYAKVYVCARRCISSSATCTAILGQQKWSLDGAHWAGNLIVLHVRMWTRQHSTIYLRQYHKSTRESISTRFGHFRRSV